MPTVLTANAVPNQGPLYGQHRPYIPQVANFGGGGHPMEDGYMELLKQREYLKAF